MTWQTRAACVTADPDLFNATTLPTAEPALAICAGCPVTLECWRQRGGPTATLPGVWAGRVYDEFGRQIRPPKHEGKPKGEVVGRCSACRRSYTARGRDDCVDRASECRKQAAEYQRARHARRRALQLRARAARGNAA